MMTQITLATVSCMRPIMRIFSLMKEPSGRSKTLGEKDGATKALPTLKQLTPNMVLAT